MKCATIAAGRYVVAVSGGIDSVSLLDYLARQPGLDLIVAHLDHGMRPSSAQEAQFVEQLAKSYGYRFVGQQVALGSQTSEATARRVRYDFLHQVRRNYDAQAIIVAHHQDDVLETAVINLLRGTGWRGLCSLRSTALIYRPLLETTKAEILAYATKHHLQWCEDATNQDQRYLRNRVRHAILPKAGKQFRQEMLALVARQAEIRQEVDKGVDYFLPLSSTNAPSAPFTPTYSAGTAGPKPLAGRDDAQGALGKEEVKLSRNLLIMLPKLVAKELLSAAVHQITGGRIEQHMSHRMWLFAKTAKPHKTLQVSKHIAVVAQKATVVVHCR